MPHPPRSPVLRYLRRILGTAEGSGVTDAGLLERYALGQNEAAFELLMWRHGGMVLRVCQDILHDVQAAEDAFQATFLALVRKARSIHKGESLSSWLYQVAYRIALRAKAQQLKCASLDEQELDLLAASASSDPQQAASQRELRGFLYEEVNRLPAKYRAPVVLCHLEGKTHEEAARQLGWPKGTVAGRLARARDLLYRRLTRRGVSLSAGLVVTVLSEHAAAASLPVRLVDSTMNAALVFAASKVAAIGVVSTRVATLAEGVLRAMFLANLKTAAALVFIAGVLASGAGALVYGVGTGAQAGALLEGPERPQPVVAAQEPPKPATAAQAGLQEEKERKQEKERAKRLEEAHRELREVQQYLHDAVMGPKWVNELVEARTKVAEQEALVSSIELEHSIDRERELADVKRTEQRILEQMEAARLISGDAASKGLEAELRRPRQQRERARNQLQAEEIRRIRRLTEARSGLIAAEEELRAVERRQAMVLERARARLETAEDRVRHLEGEALRSASGDRRLFDLERKVDILLREVAELRRGMRR